MKPSELRIQLRAALSECRKYRGDSQEHLKACFDEVMQEPVKEWAYWISYFQGEADKHRGGDGIHEKNRFNGGR